MTAENLYYRGIQVWDRHVFGAALGARVEAYVGRQLCSSGELDVISEFHWPRRGLGNAASSDWFVVTPEVTILIECKSARTNPTQRSGSQRGFQGTVDRLSMAYRQLNANVQELRAQNPAFNSIPRDRQLVGLVVTAEPFYMGNTSDMRKLLPETEMPILTASLRELERLVTLSPEVLGNALKKIVESEELYTWTLGHALDKALPEGHVREENTLIAQSFSERVLPMLPREESVRPKS